MLDELSRVSRVCAYDRSGFLWSEPRDGPRDAVRIARELHALLAAASEAPPYVLVGHSNAGLLIRVYDDLYPDEVAGSSSSMRRTWSRIAGFLRSSGG